MWSHDVSCPLLFVFLISSCWAQISMVKSWKDVPSNSKPIPPAEHDARILYGLLAIACGLIIIAAVVYHLCRLRQKEVDILQLPSYRQETEV